MKKEDFIPCDKWEDVLSEIKNPTLSNLLYNSDAYINEGAGVILVVTKAPIDFLKTRPAQFVLDTVTNSVLGKSYKILAREQKERSPAEELVMRAKRHKIDVEKE